MGTYYRAAVGIGVKLNFDALKSGTREETSCDHYERTGHSYCPVCGYKVWARQIAGNDRVVELRTHLYEDDLPEGIEIEINDCTQFIGVMWFAAEMEMALVPNFPDEAERVNILSRIKEACEGYLEAIDESTFGVYVMMPGH